MVSVREPSPPPLHPPAGGLNGRSAPDERHASRHDVTESATLFSYLRLPLSTTTNRAAVRLLQQEHACRGDHLGWFERLYQAGRDGDNVIPWADRVPNPHLVSWHRQTRCDFRNRRCLIVGCGLGDDSEYLATAGAIVTAFDVAPTAIDSCRDRFPNSSVDYQVRDLLQLPADWHEHFHFVAEIYTLQVLPTHLRQRSLSAIAQCVAPAGTLLVITRGRDDGDHEGDLPWPIAPSELALPAATPLGQTSFEDYLDREDPPVRRFRVRYDRSN